MSFSRPLIALPQSRFARGPARPAAEVEPEQRGVGDDFRLFAATFAAGFLFVSILIG
jgi:hypothetical protein